VSLSLAGIPGTVKIDRFCAKFRPFSRGYRDVCMRHQDCRRAGPMVSLAGGIWDRGVDHFPYLYEKLSRRDGFRQ
jgi:hypothetical protein